MAYTNELSSLIYLLRSEYFGEYLLLLTVFNTLEKFIRIFKKKLWKIVLLLAVHISFINLYKITNNIKLFWQFT